MHENVLYDEKFRLRKFREELWKKMKLKFDRRTMHRWLYGDEADEANSAVFQCRIPTR